MNLYNSEKSRKIERIVLARPSGNPTVLIFDQSFKGNGPELSKKFVGQKLKKFINTGYDEEIEQGGIVSSSDNQGCIGKLEMFGGEFCGNATRSAVWYLTQGKVGNGLHGNIRSIKAVGI